MKKPFVVFCLPIILVFLVATTTFASVSVNVGYDAYGYYQTSQTYTTKPGYSIGVELINSDPDSKLEWGAGVTAESNRKVKYLDKSLQYYPLYAMMNYYTSSNETTAFFTIRAGTDALNFPSSPYYALGGGVSFSRKTKLEIIYSVMAANNRYSKTSLIGSFNL